MNLFTKKTVEINSKLPPEGSDVNGPRTFSSGEK